MTAGVDLRSDTQIGSDIPILDFLNEHGRDGWELVGIVPKSHGDFGLFYFKRSVAEPVV